MARSVSSLPRHQWSVHCPSNQVNIDTNAWPPDPGPNHVMTASVAKPKNGPRQKCGGSQNVPEGGGATFRTAELRELVFVFVILSLFLNSFLFFFFSIKRGVRPPHTASHLGLGLD